MSKKIQNIITLFIPNKPTKALLTTDQFIKFIIINLHICRNFRLIFFSNIHYTTNIIIHHNYLKGKQNKTTAILKKKKNASHPKISIFYPKTFEELSRLSTSQFSPLHYVDTSHYLSVPSRLVPHPPIIIISVRQGAIWPIYAVIITLDIA